eukprot:TCONS_00011905-protein
MKKNNYGVQGTSKDLEVITEESVIQYLNEILDMYLDEPPFREPPLKSPPSTPFDDEMFFFEKEGEPSPQGQSPDSTTQLNRKDSKVFDIHYSNNGRERQNRRDSKESRTSRRGSVEIKQHCASDKTREARKQSNRVSYPGCIDKLCSNTADRYHYNLHESTHEKSFRRVDSIDLHNIESPQQSSSSKNDEIQPKPRLSLQKNRVKSKDENRKLSNANPDDIQSRTRYSIQETRVVTRKTTVSNNANREKQEPETDEIRARTSSLNLNKNRKKSIDEITQRQLRSRSTVCRPSPNREYTISLYKTTDTVGKKSGLEQSTELVCTMQMS